VSKKLNVGFITTYSGRWPKELPESRMHEYGKWVNENLTNANVICASEMGNSPEAVERITDSFKADDVDIVIMVYGAFTGDDVSTYIAQQLKVPIILWAPYEPPFEKEDRLNANALVAMTMNSASLKRLEHTCYSVYGNKEDDRAADKVKNIIASYSVVKALNKTLLGLLGYRPTAFYNCAFDEGLIRRTFGIRIEETDLKVIFDKMAEVNTSEVIEDMKNTSQTFNTTMLPDGHLENHSRLYFAMKQVMKEQKYDYGTIKCWPEMGNLHTTPCAVLGRLADEGIHVGCEGDVDAEIAQIVENMLTGLPTFITDMIDIDEEKNTMAFWHCGNSAPSLHNNKYEVTMKNHPLAGQGTAFYASLKTGPVTIARFCNIGGVYKLFLMRGEAVDTDRVTRGNMATVKVARPVREVVDSIIENQIPHHYSLVWQDVADQMIAVAKLLKIEVIEL